MRCSGAASSGPTRPSRTAAAGRRGFAAQLKNADAALLLVTPDYLASAWCRRELKIIADEQKAGRLKKVFWIQIEPSVWRGTELAAFQSWDFNLAQALSEAADINAKHRTIVKICEDIAAELDAVSAQLDDNLVVRASGARRRGHRSRAGRRQLAVGKGTVRDRLSRAQGGRGRRDQGAAPLAAQGSSPRRSATWCGARMALDNQCFIRVLAHFPVTSEHDQFHVVVEEFVGSDVLRLDEFLPRRRRLQRSASTRSPRSIRRAGEALGSSTRPARVGHAYGLLTPRHVFFDHARQRLLLPMASSLELPVGSAGLGAPGDLAGRAAEPGDLRGAGSGRRAQGDGADRSVHAGTAGVRDARRPACRWRSGGRRTSEQKAGVLGQSGDRRPRRLGERARRVRQDHLPHDEAGSGRAVAQLRRAERSGCSIWRTRAGRSRSAPSTASTASRWRTIAPSSMRSTPSSSSDRRSHQEASSPASPISPRS